MANRDYQDHAINETFRYLNETTGNGIVAMPTGTGKSHVISGITQRALAHNPGRHIQMLTHVKELVEQNAEKLLDAWPSAPLGIFSAGLGRKEIAPIIFGGVKSMLNAVDDMPPVDLAMIDECHLVNPNAETVYQEYRAALIKKNPRVRFIGTTATWWRMGTGSLLDDGGLFNHKIVDMTGVKEYLWFLEQGYLTRLIARPTVTKFDLTGVERGSDGDYRPGQLAQAMDRNEITWQALQELCHWGITQNRRSWLVFSSGVDHADHICQMLNDMGIPTTVVHRNVPKTERKQRLADFKAGKFRCMVNNNILTTGYDNPYIDLMAILRPSMSSSLWVQMLGRGTRPVYAPGHDLSTAAGRLLAIANGGKPNCMVLDFANNTANLGPINDPRIPTPKGGGAGDMPVKLCETARLKREGAKGCGCYNHTMNRYCDDCGEEFDFAVKIGYDASVAALIADGSSDQFEWFDVKNIFYSGHTGPSGKPYLRVDYWYTSKKKFTDYVHLEQSGYLLRQAQSWWKTRAKDNIVAWGAPPTVALALTKCKPEFLREPKRIYVWVNKSPIPEITNYEYE